MKELIFMSLSKPYTRNTTRLDILCAGLFRQTRFNLTFTYVPKF